MKEAPVADGPAPSNDTFSEQLQESFRARQASSSYQEMLVRYINVITIPSVLTFSTRPTATNCRLQTTATKSSARSTLLRSWCSAVRQDGRFSPFTSPSSPCSSFYSGKSTQVPTFILEDQLSHGKPCKIFCTEPRRISAISLAQRVSRELGDAPNAVGTNASLVGYSIRLESNTSKNTRLTFVTNGIALRMLESGSGQSGSGTAFDEITVCIL